MAPEKSDHDMITEMYQLILGKGGCWDRGEKTQKDFYLFRTSVIVTGALLFGGTGFGFAKLLSLLGR